MQSNFMMLLGDEEIKEIEQKIGYVFKDKRLLSKAFTHSSVTNENKNAVSNERLEFLGDRVLNFAVAKNLYFNQAGDEGKLTEKLKEKVSRAPLSESVKNLDVMKFLKTSPGSKIDSFENKAVSDLYEAVVAAIYIDSGNFSECERFIENTLTAKVKTDYISVLKEYCEKNKINIIKDSFQNPDGTFSFVITIENQKFDSAGKRLKEAEQLCSQKAVETLKIK